LIAIVFSLHVSGARSEIEQGPTRLFWGDTHVHTSYSADSYAYDNTRQGPSTAYRFARGEQVIVDDGTKVRIDRPLDFLVIADHSDGLGVLNAMTVAGGSGFLQSEQGKRWYSELQREMGRHGVTSGSALYRGFKVLGFSDPLVTEFGDEYYGSSKFQKTVWDEVINLAEQYNEPGSFTAFIGFEWTSGTTGTMLHRVVVFRDGKEKVSQVLPYTVAESDAVEDLWWYMASYQRDTDGGILAIPHNGNMSNGQMFLPVDSGGKAIDRAYAMLRSKMEPLFEVTQIKGDSETHPLLSPTDEFADFERWRLTDADPQYEYARSALKSGLQHQQNLQVNPFKFGMIGSTDTHTSLTTVEEQDFWGKFYTLQPSPDRILRTQVFPALASKWGAAGLAAVWAKENSRESLFEAMQRKETYATTGPRIGLRFFGGWDYQTEEAMAPDLASVGYRKGVPMGGDLPQAPQGQSPVFLIRAMKDPQGANLDRIQIVKGSLDRLGNLNERVFNVALSGDRQVAADGEAPPVGNTVDLEAPSYDNSIGDAELAAVWRDPEFKRDDSAFYYVRVLEIPTPRWTAYDAARFNLSLPGDIPQIVQERAYSSPIWYTPSDEVLSKGASSGARM